MAVISSAAARAHHLRDRETIFDIISPTRGCFCVIGCPVRPFDSPVAVKRAPPIGENTE
jgi:hypothetical protein